jgi:competence protein ComGF
MAWTDLESLWPILALLAGALAFAMLAVLAAQQRHALEQHNHIRTSRSLRLKYLESLKNRRNTY